MTDTDWCTLVNCITWQKKEAFIQCMQLSVQFTDKWQEFVFVPLCNESTSFRELSSASK